MSVPSCVAAAGLCALAASAAPVPPPRPALPFTVTPAALGRQMVRASLPLPAGALRAGERLAVTAPDGSHVPVSTRVLTWRPARAGEARSARRAIVTFPVTFGALRPMRFRASAGAPGHPAPFPFRVSVTAGSVTVAMPGGRSLVAELIAPDRGSAAAPRIETVERSAHYLWLRAHVPGAPWPRVLEVRVDALGQVMLTGRLRRDIAGDGRAPDLGWRIRVAPAQGAPALASGGTTAPLADAIGRAEPSHVTRTADSVTAWMEDGQRREVRLDGGAIAVYQPRGHLRRRETVGLATAGPAAGSVTLLACDARARVPMQQASWRSAEVVVAPAALARVTPALGCPHRVDAPASVWRDLYFLGDPLDLTQQPELAELLRYHHSAVAASMARGDDLGNVTGFSDTLDRGPVFGMNRLNHCPAIFEEGWRSGDRRLLETALLWCDNFVDQTIWWGPGETGGTRYNNITGMGQKPPENDQTYMWRSNSSVNFCTKGYDAFYLAYEETGDPRMQEALEAQLAYAAQSLHTNRGETRNIGDVRDFLRLYRWTGERRYLDEALRLFRELRTKLSTGDRFDQGGKPIAASPPFIENDAHGLNIGYAKPYIIGYALAGLPEMIPILPAEPKLRDVVRAVADFMCESQDPLGGWRYPHPRSSAMILSQAMEHAWQIVQAARTLGPEPRYLDAIERVLRQRLHGWRATGQCFGGLTGWEITTGRARTADDVAAMYAHPENRTAERDYAEGSPGFGGSAPEGLVYFPEVLAYYLRHRPASRLTAAPEAGSPLATVLARVPRRAKPAAKGAHSMFETPGVVQNLPAFHDRLASRLTFPMSWLNGHRTDFAAWRRSARARVRRALLTPPPAAPFAPRIVAEQDRGAYVARKITLDLTADSRVLAYMLVPKGRGPFPTVLLLHDHGARFDIGKEKVIAPFDDTPEKLRSAREWVDQLYGGRFIGDELATRGYVCFCTDMINWSDRGGGGYEGQQALASCLLQFGTSWAGLIAWEDLRAVDFLAGRPEVDRSRIAAMGLSVGGYRTWQIAALTDRIAAGASICWMSTTRALMSPGNNQTTGQSAFTMIHPGLRNDLDYSDVASIACPKPMLFYAGRQDRLFPVASVEEAYARMHRVWTSQGAGDRLETRVWDVPHVFSREMQDAAFAWLDRALARGKEKAGPTPK